MTTDESEITAYRILVNSWITAFNTHDVTAIVSLYAEDAELFDSGMKYPRQGKHAIENWFTQRFQTMPTISYTPIYQIFGEAQAAVTWTARGRSPRILGQAWLSRPFQVDGVSVFTLADGLIQKQRGYYDHLATLEQILPFLKWILPQRL
ncbi:MAG: nuclear transport factor 2 family protein [Ktedonobacteraceae bacterium]